MARKYDDKGRYGSRGRGRGAEGGLPVNSVRVQRRMALLSVSVVVAVSRRSRSPKLQVKLPSKAKKTPPCYDYGALESERASSQRRPFLSAEQRTALGLLVLVHSLFGCVMMCFFHPGFLFKKEGRYQGEVFGADTRGGLGLTLTRAATQHFSQQTQAQ
jgi:hypothetical protein